MEKVLVIPVGYDEYTGIYDYTVNDSKYYTAINVIKHIEDTISNIADLYDCVEVCGSVKCSFYLHNFEYVIDPFYE